ncbi:MAG: alpha/beta hydrolase [Pseudomonadota bacterium]
MENNAPHYIDGPHGRLAYRMQEGAGPTLVWLGGYASDMLGTKAEALAAYASQTEQSYLRFDYSGHGESDGTFEDLVLSDWLSDSRIMLDTKAPGRKLLIGSSMGAWITLLLALQKPEEIAGIVLIAPAPDFTERLVWPRLPEQHRKAVLEDGLVRTGPTGHDSETFTKALFDDGRTHLLMDGPIALPCPVRILQGTADVPVPTQHALDLAELIEAQSVVTTLVKGGDHRLSEPSDLERLVRTVAELIH